MGNFVHRANARARSLARFCARRSDDASSGIYFRCLDAKKITDRTCYEANIFDQRPDPSYGTGSITRYVEINFMPKAGGKWNTFEITAKGRDITVGLNGKKTAEMRNGMFDEGWIAGEGEPVRSICLPPNPMQQLS